ncbi:SusC/RagA family TonB-linked outer membrane protein [Chitinophaga sp.]|uniref:SusC/RagA family TonB-linked outer membrane protein n=1 Tax=Chitinophaga sp. TaxID=1869181 RepID=UPI0031D43B73
MSVQLKTKRGPRWPLLFLLLLLTGWRAADGQETLSTLTAGIRFSAREISATRLFDELKIQSGYNFLFDRHRFDNILLSNLKYERSTLGAVLTGLQEKQGFLFSVAGRNIAVKPSSTVPPGSITGKITEEEGGEPVEGAVIRVNNKGVTSRADGTFAISLPPGRYSVSISFVGYTTWQAAGVEVKPGEATPLQVRLKRESGKLSTVVVTALGIRREVKALSYSQQGIDMNTMNETKSPNIINQLSGKIAGLQVVPSGFNTGSSRVIIRGNSSLTGNNQPLFVVDGMPIDNEMGDAGSIDYGNNAADLNPEDIESIQVLKGPNASALYGSRAANGVILVTTKKGSGKFRVSVNSSTMFQRLTEFPEYQNAYGVGTSFYIDNTNRIPQAVKNYRSWGAPMLGQPYVALNGEIKPYLPQPDNVKDFYNTARLLTNTVAVEGGNANTQYRIAYTNYDGTSIVKGFNENNKHNINIRLLNKMGNRFSADTKINFIRDVVNNRQYSNANGRNPTNLYTHMARSTDLAELLPYKDPVTGKETGTHRNFSNPYWVINENPNKDTKDRVIASFSPELKIASWLKLTGRAGADIYWWEGFEFNNIGSIVASNPDGFMRTFNTRQQNFNLETILTADKKFNNFSLIANAGASRFSTGYERREQRVNSLLQPGLINLSNAKEYPVATQNRRDRQLNSVFGAVSLGYQNFAFLDVTGRNDWSSTLPAGGNSYFYHSMGGTLILTDMLNIKSNLLNFAKLRASYAVVGNDTDPYRLEQTYSFNGFFNGATIASLSTTMNNPNLKPEKTASFETGLDLRLFRNRLNIDATYYNAATTNQIITAQLPASSGYQRRLYNAGKIRNWGYELSMTGTIVQTRKLKWETSLNFSRNNSEVVELIDGVPRFQLNNNSSYIYVYAEVGKPYAYLRGLGVARNEKGQMLIEDGGSLLVKDNDMAFGTATPDWIGGISNRISLGAFDLGFLLDFKKGGVLYSGSYSRMLTNGVAAETLYGRDDYYKHTVIFGESNNELTGGAMWDAYFADGTKNNKYVTPQNYEYARPNYAEFVMFDASFIKLREVTLGYTVQPGLLKGTPLKDARVSLAGRNLAIFHRKTPRGIDPEASSTSGNGQGIENGSLPPNAIYGFNIRLTF